MNNLRQMIVDNDNNSLFSFSDRIGGVGLELNEISESLKYKTKKRPLNIQDEIKKIQRDITLLQSIVNKLKVLK